MKQPSTGTKKELLAEITSLRERIQILEQAETLCNQVAAALSESERRFQSLVEATSDWIWEIDSQGRYVFASPKIMDLLGYAPEEVLGRTPYDLMSPHEAERVRPLFDEIAAARKSFSLLTNANLHKDGHEVIVETSGVPVFDYRGDYVGYRGYDHNITERHQAEEALLQNRLHLSEAMDLANIVCWQADPLTNILALNDPYYAFLGTDAEREGGYLMKRGDYVQRFLHPEDQERFHALAAQLLASPMADTVASYEHRIIRCSGEIRHVLTRIRVLKDSAGAIIRVYGTDQDITARKEAEREQERLILELEQALAQVKTLKGLLPVCSACRRIRDKSGRWEQMEVYIRNHSEADFSHGICPECAAKLYPDFLDD